ncbi:TIGR04283 family arsenosugar biosynthesis glycosyltransferase [Aurantibacter sp.]|uniref:TIGR04283 family arsenosugar biosynthesis glycosyltransferase n=1 Tax=Aurantibacter sp. TaxID=2807103 RepID=UPI003266F6EE
MSISIIIPVFNEASIIASLLTYLKQNSDKRNIKEIIVVDGGSTDQTITIAKESGAKVIQSVKGRSRQLNCGAKYAIGNILYFLHVDTLPPKNFDSSILSAVHANSQAGCFRMKFDTKNTFLSFFAWMTKLNFKICRGGDQSLFITKELFELTGGFNESYDVYEDNEFTDRLYEIIDFKILPRHVITSARRYEEIGTVKLQYYFGVMHFKNYTGAGPKKLHEYYLRKIAV